MLRHFKSNQNESTGSLDSVGSGNCLDCSEEHESGSDHEDVEGFVGEHVGLVLVLRMKWEKATTRLHLCMFFFCSSGSVRTYYGQWYIHSFEVNMTTNIKDMKFGKQTPGNNGYTGVNDTTWQKAELPNKGSGHLVAVCSPKIAKDTFCHKKKRVSERGSENRLECRCAWVCLFGGQHSHAWMLTEPHRASFCFHFPTLTLRRWLPTPMVEMRNTSSLKAISYVNGRSERGVSRPILFLLSSI